jgi:hypothetical protein
MAMAQLQLGLVVPVYDEIGRLADYTKLAGRLHRGARCGGAAVRRRRQYRRDTGRAGRAHRRASGCAGRGPPPAPCRQGHVRRYSRAALDVELAGARLRPLVLTHVFSWLVPPTLLMRRLLGGGSVASGHEHSSLVVDRAALALTFAERSLLARVSLPFGTSVLCVATPAA